MEAQEMYKLMYPIGKYEAPAIITQQHIDEWKETIDEASTLVFELVSNLTTEELQYKYRPQGWNITQVLHHLTDSHMNAFIRFKLALAEDTPTIKPYPEGLWANLADVDESLNEHAFHILDAVHAKWLAILDSMSLEDFHNKAYYHPGAKINYTLGVALGMYDWHCKHHIEHIKQALKHKFSE